MQEQTTKKGTATKIRNSKGPQQGVDIARLTPPSADALREAHMNLVRAEQNLYSIMQASSAGGALLGSQPSFGQSAVHATQGGYEAPPFNAGFGHPAAFQGFPGVGTGMVPSLSSFGANPQATGSQWNPWTAALSATQGTTPNSALAGRSVASVAPGQTSSSRTLACDIIDEGQQIVCQLELPGVEADQVEVLCFGSAVTVSAYREPEGEILNLVQSERATATQERIIRLPSEVQPSSATATLANGVLTIALPKLYPTEGPRLVEINS